ncbi:MAG: hypothetical protein EBY16_07110, partial [Gammaproteobacteria bacterium]|nr:hypothetical protein [Gammaproteobacteria bacterium]
MFNHSYRYYAKYRYKNSWLRFLLQYTALGRLLIQDTTPTPSVFFNTYHSSWWLTRSLFSWMIQNTDLFYIIKSLSLLKTVSMDYDQLVRGVANHQNPKNIVDELFTLQQAEILTQENIGTVVAHANPRELA